MPLDIDTYAGHTSPVRLRNAATRRIRASDDAPRVLVMTAYHWLSKTRLALALSETGIVVDALCPSGHSLERVKFVSTTYRYSALSSVRSLRDAIEASNPDLLIPTDDEMAAQLHKLYALTKATDPADEQLRALIARSLGDPEQYQNFHARDQIASLAHAAGVLCPPVVVVDNEDELLYQLAGTGFPAVLKTDRSSGGTGVAIVRTQVEAKSAFRRLSANPSIVRALKRWMIDGDRNLVLPALRRDRSRISIQRFIYGRQANAAVACWKGEILAVTCVEVLASIGATGPATVVRVIPHPGMSQAAERMTRQLKLSGLCGFDFILDPSDESAHLIEFNPRATQTCHLASSDGKQPLVSLAAKLQGFPVVESRPGSWHCCPVVLFPHGFARDAKSLYSQYVDSDLPRNSPELCKLGMELHRQRFLPNAIQYVREKLF
jgi:carbamoylphosphate synthase large subunit